MQFKIIKQSLKTHARAGLIHTSHGNIHTPVFTPCATMGAVKGVTSEELNEMGYEMILANAYHLYLRPGEKQIKIIGGLHRFMNWNRPILTDSGGYQVFSLGKNFRNYREERAEHTEFENGQGVLVEVSRDGVWFRSHLDGSKHFFTPEKVIDIQKDLQSDIMMVLDECTEYPATQHRAKESMTMTHEWAQRSIDYWQR